MLELSQSLSAKYWLNVADRSLPFVGVIEHTNLIDKSLYGGRHIVYLTNYPDPKSELYQKSGEELLEDFIPHLKKINPDFDRSWILNYHHTKWTRPSPSLESTTAGASPITAHP